ncbi:Beta-hexosaminidase subunit B1 [Bienertia sinuspersici]
MALFRALSTRRSQRGGGYDRLSDETVAINDATLSDADHHHHHHHHHHGHDTVLKRVTSVPASMLFGSSSKKVGLETNYPGSNSKPKQSKKSSGNKSSHPVFSLFEGKWKKKKITANPDFSRYIEYLKEGGMLNKNTNSPVL